MLGGFAAAAAVLGAPAALGQAERRVVVVGGGFAGASCARALKREDSALSVTLVEPSATYTACPFSNEVIAGRRELSAQRFGYDGLARDGIAIVALAAVAVDAERRQIRLGDGTSLGYDRLVLAPGIDIRFDALPGYSQAAAEIMPHAW